MKQLIALGVVLLLSACGRTNPSTSGSEGSALRCVSQQQTISGFRGLAVGTSDNVLASVKDGESNSLLGPTGDEKKDGLHLMTFLNQGPGEYKIEISDKANDFKVIETYRVTVTSGDATSIVIVCK